MMRHYNIDIKFKDPDKEDSILFLEADTDVEVIMKVSEYFKEEEPDVTIDKLSFFWYIPSKDVV